MWRLACLVCCGRLTQIHLTADVDNVYVADRVDVAAERLNTRQDVDRLVKRAPIVRSLRCVK